MKRKPLWKLYLGRFTHFCKTVWWKLTVGPDESGN